MMQNLNPYYQLHLGLIDVTLIDHLVELCSKLEIKKYSIENFSKPSRKKGELEPDLAYVGVASISSFPSTSSGIRCASVNVMKCWNCHKSGHKSRDCEQAHKIHCYKCGKPNVTVRNCQNCTSHSKN